MYESPAEQSRIRATRKDWKVSSCSEAGVPVVAISSHGS